MSVVRHPLADESIHLTYLAESRSEGGLLGSKAMLAERHVPAHTVLVLCMVTNENRVVTA